MAAEIPPEEGGAPGPPWAPRPKAPLAERGVPPTSGCENLRGRLELREMLFEGPRVDRLADDLTCSESKCRGGVARGAQGGTESSRFVEDGGEEGRRGGPSQTAVRAEGRVPSLQIQAAAVS